MRNHEAPGKWRRRGRNRRRLKEEEEAALRRQTEQMIKRELSELLEKASLRLFCDFGGAPCMGENDREMLLKLAKEADNFPLWKEMNFPGNVFLIESIEIAEIVWPVKKSAAAEIWEKIKRFFSEFRKKKASRKGKGSGRKKNPGKHNMR